MLTSSFASMRVRHEVLFEAKHCRVYGLKGFIGFRAYKGFRVLNFFGFRKGLGCVGYRVYRV